MPARIDIYYASICGLCTKTLEYFRSKGASFSAYAVEWDAVNDRFVDSENVRQMYRKCGEEVDFVPQIFVGDRHIKGWRALEPMIASGEINQLIPPPQ